MTSNEELKKRWKGYPRNLLVLETGIIMEVVKDGFERKCGKTSDTRVKGWSRNECYNCFSNGLKKEERDRKAALKLSGTPNPSADRLEADYLDKIETAKYRPAGELEDWF